MRWLALILFLLAACSEGAEADLPSIGEARSLIAEWALINDEAAAGRLNATYVKTMRKQLREQLKTTASSLSQSNTNYAAEVQACLKLPDEVAPTTLRAHSDALKRIEDSLESA
jgi:hypothetical protein